MNLLFITISHLSNINDSNIYTDLMRTFRDKGHQVYIVSPRERRYKISTGLNIQENVYLLGVKTLNIQKTNVIEKGIGTVLIEKQFNRAIKKYLKDIKFDLILYSTPPITLTSTIKKIKQRDKAKTYLLLKDIFPQNAVDLGMIKKNGLIHRYFRHKEILLYKISDYIGCMSPVNVEYIIKHNPKILYNKPIEVSPNCIDVPINNEKLNKIDILKKYNIPENVVKFIYGGNLGKPQGIDFLLRIIEQTKNEKAFFIIAGTGTEYSRINKWFELNNPTNALLIHQLPVDEYEKLVKSCDVGLILLDKRFTIPNFPSRLLSYISNFIPVLTITDKNTDIGSIAVKNGYGFWAEHGDLDASLECLRLFYDKNKRKEMGRNGYEFFLNNYTTSYCYDSIIKHLK